MEQVIVTAPESTGRRRVRWITVVVLLVVLGALSGLLWLRLQNRFPLVAQGSWIGEITEVYPESVFFVVNRLDDSSVYVAVLKAGWEPQRVSFAQLGVTKGADGDESSLPLSLSNGSETLVLVGGASGPGRYAGTVEQLGSKARGHWELQPTSGRTRGGDEKLVVSWLALREALAEGERRKASALAQLEDQSAEFARLKEFVSSSGKLKASADSKFQEARAELSQLQESAKKARAETKRLEERLRLAQQVTPMGRLVSLSRDSLERENRWIETFIRIGADQQRLQEEEERRRKEAGEDFGGDPEVSETIGSSSPESGQGALSPADGGYSSVTHGALSGVNRSGVVP